MFRVESRRSPCGDAAPSSRATQRRWRSRLWRRPAGEPLRRRLRGPPRRRQTGRGNGRRPALRPQRPPKFARAHGPFTLVTPSSKPPSNRTSVLAFTGPAPVTSSTRRPRHTRRPGPMSRARPRQVAGAPAFPRARDPWRQRSGPDGPGGARRRHRAARPQDSRLGSFVRMDLPAALEEGLGASSRSSTTSARRVPVSSTATRGARQARGRRTAARRHSPEREGRCALGSRVLELARRGTKRDAAGLGEWALVPFEPRGA